MNDFQNIDAGKAELKDMYFNGMTPLEAALKRKRKKLAETKIGLDNTDEDLSMEDK